MSGSAVAEFPSTAELVEGILNADRARMGQAISLVESELPLHRERAEELLEQLGPAAGKSWRIGITGVPGAGKSSFLEQLGLYITREREEKVAVLAIDPSSPISGGSILGDKTRMNDLARDPRAFIRPSPSGGTFGGVARRSQEIIRICEAAGFQYCFIETVGVGQSEDLVKKLSDAMILLMITGAGDQLQGIKRGIMEVADLVLVNKADGSNTVPAKKDPCGAAAVRRHASSSSARTSCGLRHMYFTGPKGYATYLDPSDGPPQLCGGQWLVEGESRHTGPVLGACTTE